jgi:hypothetical protein
VEELARENRLVLDRLGREELLKDTLEAGTGRRAPLRIAPLQAHEATVIRFWAQLAVTCFRSRIISLARFRFEHELAPGHLDTLRAHRPDAHFEVVADGASRHVFLECDRGTESPSTVAKKCIAYARHRTAGLPVAGVVPDQVALLVPRPRRLEVLARSLHEVPVPIRAIVFDERSTALDLADGWRSLGRESDGDLVGGLVSR